MNADADRPAEHGPGTRPCPHCGRPIYRARVRGRRVGDWTCWTCCAAWDELPTPGETP